MNKSDLLKQIATAITKSAKKVDPKLMTKGGRIVSALGAAKLADDVILDNIPGLKDAMVWTDEKITQGQQWLVDNTLGKIPGVGPVLSKLNKYKTDARYKLRDALFGKNSPDWYEHLPQHVKFSVPGGYNNKTIKFELATKSYTTIPSVITIELVRNLVTTPYATTSRYSEIYTAVKYARGLSYLSYNVNQLAAMFEISNELAILYYRIAKGVSAAFHFTMTKANVPTILLKSLKFDDMIDNYHEYMTLLNQMYNFMSVNAPMLPIMHKKLRQMSLFTALDSEKPAMSTYMQAFIYNNKIQLKDDKFYSNTVDAPRTLQDCRGLFQYYMDLINNTTIDRSTFLDVIADVKGSIASLEYVDNWVNVKFDQTFTNDTLFLNSIKNMDLPPMFGLVGTYQAADFGFVCDTFVNASQGSSVNPIDVSKGIGRDVTLRFKSTNKAGGDTFKPTYICCSGSKQVKQFAYNVASESVTPYYFDLFIRSKEERVVSLEGNESTEGMVLETISLSNIVKSCNIEPPTATTPCYTDIVVDPSLFVGIRINVENGYDDQETKYIANILTVPGWDLRDTHTKLATTWTLVDWMPCVYSTAFTAANTFYTAMLWDLNGIGSLSYNSIETAIDYITYSLLYPGDVEALNKVELANKLISSLRNK